MLDIKLAHRSVLSTSFTFCSRLRISRTVSSEVSWPSSTALEKCLSHAGGVQMKDWLLTQMLNRLARASKQTEAH